MEIDDLTELLKLEMKQVNDLLISTSVTEPSGYVGQDIRSIYKNRAKLSRQLKSIRDNSIRLEKKLYADSADKYVETEE